MKRLRERARAVALIRQFFEARGFLEVTTPVMVPSPGMDLHLDAFGVAGTGEGDEARWLSTSPEYQMKRLLADGWERIYQITPCFRRGERGARHSPEFTMLEWYRAHAGIDDVMRDTEQLVARVTGGWVRLGQRSIDVQPPYARLPLCEAFSRFAGWSESQTLAAAAGDEDGFYRCFVERVEPGLERENRALFLVDYPATQASLARKKPDDPRFAERFELYVGGVELCNGFGELVDVLEQRARFTHDQQERRTRGLPVYAIDERFLEALARVPASGGNALGVDRLVALTCGTTEIADVLAFSPDEL